MTRNRTKHDIKWNRDEFIQQPQKILSCIQKATVCSLQSKSLLKLVAKSAYI